MRKKIILFASIFLVLIVALITYNLFSFFNNNQPIEDFEAELDTLITQQQEEFELEDLSERFTVVDISYQYDSDLLVNPFASTLEARKKADSLLDSLNGIGIEPELIRKEAEAQAEEDDEELDEFDEQINLKGTLSNRRGWLAIVEVVASGERKIIRPGDKVQEFKVYEIESENIIFSRDGEYFIYSFGGEDN